MTRRFFVQLLSLASALVAAPWTARPAARATTGQPVYACAGCGASVRLHMKGSAPFQVMEGTRFPELLPWRILPEGRLVGHHEQRVGAEYKLVKYSVKCAACAAKADAAGGSHSMVVRLTEPEQLQLEGALDREILLAHGVPLRF